MVGWPRSKAAVKSQTQTGSVAAAKSSPPLGDHSCPKWVPFGLPFTSGRPRRLPGDVPPIWAGPGDVLTRPRDARAAPRG
jgi:hypothetical protein